MGQSCLDGLLGERVGKTDTGAPQKREEGALREFRRATDAAMLAVGAAFDYGAGTLAPPPSWMQRVGLQWL